MQQNHIFIGFEAFTPLDPRAIGESGRQERLMNFLKKLFAGAGSASGDAKGLYYYVKPTGCDEVVRVRIDRNNDLSLSDDGKSYWVHKVVMGTTCFQRAEIDFYFSSSRQLTNSEISGGDLVKQDDYEAWLASRQSPTES